MLDGSWRLGRRGTARGHIVAAAQALEFAHERGVLHRDVKPSNLMIPDVPRTPVNVLLWGLLKASVSEDGLPGRPGPRRQ